ncbi:MAG: alanine racemase [Rhodospirillales bacterium]|nr:alanine racemase [Rhodospirillales bacterium]
MPKREHSGAVLTIDLSAVCANWRLLRDRVGTNTECAGVVKADGYGLGVQKVAKALFGAGCRTFFVAHLNEALDLRAVLPAVEIHVLNGLLPGTEPELAENGLVPVLNALGDIDAWRKFCVEKNRKLPADIHIDTGMSRLGLPPSEVAVMAAEPHRLDGISVSSLMSHLACADEPEHPLNRKQLADFQTALSVFPAARHSFANSSGIFLGPDFHFDLARPGVALYGANPTPGQSNPMTQVVRLQGKILQVRDVDTPQTVGYGASHHVTGPTRVATVAVGYADGFLRSSGNSGVGYVGDVQAPMVGRVSMDLITLDVSSVPESQSAPGCLVDLIGPNNPVDAVAETAGTIGYEILTSLGKRYHRVYVGDEF